MLGYRSHLLVEDRGFVKEKVEVVLRGDLAISVMNGTFERSSPLAAHLQRERILVNFITHYETFIPLP